MIIYKQLVYKKMDLALTELFLEIIPLGQSHINFLLNGRLRANSR